MACVSLGLTARSRPLVSKGECFASLSPTELVQYPYCQESAGKSNAESAEKEKNTPLCNDLFIASE